MFLTAAVLEALVSPESGLKKVGVSFAAAHTPLSLAAFTSLEECAFWEIGEEDSTIDLAPLGVLPSLRSLALRGGRYDGLSHLTRLTRLDFTDALNSDDSQLAPTLQHLSVQDGDLDDVPCEQGLSTCTALTQLVFNKVRYSSGLYDEDRMAACGLTEANDTQLLTQLRTLDITTYMPVWDLVSGPICDHSPWTIPAG